MSYPYGTKGPAGAPRVGRAPAGMSAFPVVGNGLPGLPVRKRRSLSGQAIIERSYAEVNPSGDKTWVVPPGVHSISVLFVRSGAMGNTGGNGSSGAGGSWGLGGVGGWSYYLNDIPVQPGEIITFNTASFRGLQVSEKFTSIAQAGQGLRGGSGTLSGAGANGTGGNGLNLINGALGPAGDPAFGGDFAYPSTEGARFGGGGGGGGGGMRGGPFAGQSGDLPNRGALRIIWPGNQRQFPATRTEDE